MFWFSIPCDDPSSLAAVAEESRPPEYSDSLPFFDIDQYISYSRRPSALLKNDSWSSPGRLKSASSGSYGFSGAELDGEDSREDDIESGALVSISSRSEEGNDDVHKDRSDRGAEKDSIASAIRVVQVRSSTQ